MTKNNKLSLLFLSVIFGFFMFFPSCSFFEGLFDDNPPAEVSNLTAIAGDKRVTLSWTEPTNSDFAKVEITYLPNGSTPIKVNKGITTYRITDLTNGTNYTFTIKTVDLYNNKSYGIQIQKNPEPGIVSLSALYGGSLEDSASSICHTSDGGYIVVGSSYSNNIYGLTNHGGADYYIIKFDSNDNIIWEKMYGGSGSDSAPSFCQTSGGEYIIVGYSWSNNIAGTIYHGNADCYIIKLDSSGDLDWQKMYGGTVDDKIYSICQTSDEEYIFAGISNSTDIQGTPNHGSNDIFILIIE